MIMMERKENIKAKLNLAGLEPPTFRFVGLGSIPNPLSAADKTYEPS